MCIVNILTNLQAFYHLSDTELIYFIHLFIFSWYNNYIKAEQWQHHQIETP